jgi:hypothetical protein
MAGRPPHSSWAAEAGCAAERGVALAWSLIAPHLLQQRMEVVVVVVVK